MNPELILIPDFEKRGGIIPVVIQDVVTLEVITLAYTRKEEHAETLQTREVVLYSTSRDCRWKKGEVKSGNIYRLQQFRLDCDKDAIVYVVLQTKPEAGACHTGATSCFSTVWEA